jgi:hypothetical protein
MLSTSLEQGVELVVIKELLGHAHIASPTTPASDSAFQRNPAQPTTPTRRRATTLCSTRPLTLPSTTAVRHPRSPTGFYSGGARRLREILFSDSPVEPTNPPIVDFEGRLLSLFYLRWNYLRRQSYS